MPSRTKHVIFVAPTWLGDAVMSLPLLGFIAASPAVRMTVLSRAYAARVYCGMDAVADLVVGDGRSRPARVWGQGRLLKKLRADGAVILPPSFSSALGAFLAGVPVRVGFRSDARRFLLTTSPEVDGLRDEHLSHNYLRLGRALFERLGLPADHSYTTPRVSVAVGERESLGALMRTLGVPNGGYAVVVPGATYGPTKSWPKEKYRGLVGRLSSEIPVLLGGSAGERELCSTVGDGLANVFNLAGMTSLGQFVALLGGARVLVANDSGSPHVAASLGVPVVVIFGSTSPRWTSPLGERVHVVTKPTHCSPCFLRECPTRLECYERISVEKVFKTTRQVVKNGIEKNGRG